MASAWGKAWGVSWGVSWGAGVTPPPAPPPASGGKPLRVRPTKTPEMLEWVSDYVFDDAEARKRKRKRAEILLLMH